MVKQKKVSAALQRTNYRFHLQKATVGTSPQVYQAAFSRIDDKLKTLAAAGGNAFCIADLPGHCIRDIKRDLAVCHFHCIPTPDISPGGRAEGRGRSGGRPRGRSSGTGALASAGEGAPASAGEGAPASAGEGGLGALRPGAS